MSVARRSRRARRERPAAAPARADVTWSRADVAWAGAVFASAFVLFALTAARDIVAGDTPELAAAALTLGVPHAPGYPLLTMLGAIAAAIPLGPAPLRLDLFAALAGAGTATAVYATGRVLTGSRLAGAAAAAALAVDPIHWRWSTVFEAFGLHALLVSLAFLFLALFFQRPDRIALLFAAAVAGALDLGGHQTIVLAAPAFVVAIAVAHDRPRALGACALAAVLGLAPFAYIPFAASRGPAISWGEVDSLASFASVFLRLDYGGAQLTLAQGQTSPFARLGVLLASTSPLLGALAVAGGFAAYRERRAHVIAVASAILLAGPVFFAYANADATTVIGRWVLERFTLMPHVLAAPLVAPGIVALAARARRLGASAALARYAAAPVIAVAVVIAALSYPSQDLSADRTARTFAEDLLATVEPAALFVARGDAMYFPTQYVQVVEGRRPDVILVALPLMRLEWYVRQLRRLHPDLVLPLPAYRVGDGSLKAFFDANRGRPTYVQAEFENDTVRFDATLVGTYRYSFRGLLYKLEPADAFVGGAAFAAENERLFATYRPPGRRAAARAWESEIQDLYALAAYRIGRAHELAGETAEARKWYGRALFIDPDLALARSGAARVGR